MKNYIFADESNLNSRYMLIGGIWVNEAVYKTVANECKKFKADNGWKPNTKLNWKNISKKTLAQYKMFIDIFFKHNLQFNCIIIDQAMYKLKNNKERDEELGFYKFYYLLLRNCSVRNASYYIYLDRKNNSVTNRLDTMKMYLKGSRLRFSNSYGLYNEKGIDVKTIEFVNSDTYNLIQFADLLMGAFGYHYNMRHLKSDASPHKTDFANYIAAILNKENLIFETEKRGYKNLNIWKFKSYDSLNN